MKKKKIYCSIAKSKSLLGILLLTLILMMPHVNVFATTHGLEISHKKLTIYKGSSKTIKCYASSEGTPVTNQKKKWSSSNKSVATVNQSGKITAKKVGTATISCTISYNYGGSRHTKTKECKVTVKKKVATTKKNAMKAYKKKLEGATYKSHISDYGERYYYRFSVAYIDNNNIPELIILDSSDSGDLRNAKIYTFENGEIKKLGYLDLGDVTEYSNNSSLKNLEAVYYKKKNLIYDNSSDGCANVFYEWKKISNSKIKSLKYTKIISGDLSIVDFNNAHYRDGEEGIRYAKANYKNNYRTYTEISKSAYDSWVKKVTKSAKPTHFVWHKNTASNRKKYLK